MCVFRAIFAGDKKLLIIFQGGVSVPRPGGLRDRRLQGRLRRRVRSRGRGGRGVPRPAPSLGRRPARQARPQKVGGHAALLIFAVRGTGEWGYRVVHLVVDFHLLTSNFILI